jgi:catechol 2,3-dioxygenase-like lactoylglutathione lyase family enzyme
LTPDHPSLAPHHVGCAVKDIDAAYSSYVDALGALRRTRALEVLSQNVAVCFIELRPGFYLELVAPLNDQARLANYMKAGFYHLCFLVDDLEAQQVKLEDKPFFAFPPFESEAFAGKPCQFFLNPQGHLIEFAEIGPSDFEAFFEAHLA